MFASMLATDVITEITINEAGQLLIKPDTQKFILIWRSATEVHWNIEGAYLYSPKPREWSYVDWYKHIVKVIYDECGCRLVISNSTKWVNIPDDLKEQILNLNF